MPSKSAKQRRTMAAAAHDPAFAKKMDIPMSVAKEFNRADMIDHHKRRQKEMDKRMGPMMHGKKRGR